MTEGVYLCHTCASELSLSFYSSPISKCFSLAQVHAHSHTHLKCPRHDETLGWGEDVAQR